MSKQSEEADATDKVYKAFAAQAAAEFPDDQTTLEGKTSASPATLKQRAEFIKSLREAWDEKHEPQKPFVPGDASTMSKKQIRQVTEWSKLLDDVRSRPDAIMPPAAKQQAEAAIHALHAELAQYGSFQDPAKPIKKADEQIIMQSRGIVNSIPPRPQSAPLQGLREENKPATSFETNLQQLQSRQDLPPEVKSPLIRDIAAARTMINEAGGFDKLSAEKKRFVIDAARAFEELPKPGSGEAGQVSGAAMRSALELNLRRPQAGGIGDYLKRMASQTD